MACNFGVEISLLVSRIEALYLWRIKHLRPLRTPQSSVNLSGA